MLFCIMNLKIIFFSLTVSSASKNPKSYKSVIQAIQNSGFRMHIVYVNGSPNTMRDQANIISYDAVQFFIALQLQ